MADTKRFEARTRARAAMDRVGECLAAGHPPDAGVGRDLAALAARIDARLWDNDDEAEAVAR